MTTTETRDYETLADRELDALVAERVFGKATKHQGDGRGGEWLLFEESADSPFTSEVPRYSTDPAAAFTVLEAMRAKGYSWEVGRGYDDLVRVHLRNGPARTGTYIADSMPRAAVIAALRALDAEAR